MFINIGILSRCNLKCKFCYCKQDKPHDLPELINAPDKIVQCIIDNNICCDHWDIGIVGGEIFMDGLSDSVFEQYDRLLTSLQHKLLQLNPKATFQLHCYSNGVYYKIDRVIDFLKQWNSEIVLSYDSVHRFQNEKQKQLMLDNMKMFKHCQINIRPTVVLFKEQDTSEQFLSSDVFRQIYDTTGLEYQLCIPNMFNFTPQMIAQFYINAIDKGLSQIENVRVLLDAFTEKHIERVCKRSITYYEDQVYLGCHYIKSDFTNLRYRILDRFGCLTCDYFAKCPSLCWVESNQFDNQYCINKAVFEHLTNQ